MTIFAIVGIVAVAYCVSVVAVARKRRNTSVGDQPPVHNELRPEVFRRFNPVVPSERIGVGELSPSEFATLENMVAGDPEEKTLRVQLDLVTVEERDYTGGGVYVKLAIPHGTKRLQKSSRMLEDTPMAYCSHHNLEEGGSARLWFDDGYMSTIEYLAFEGSWPKDDFPFEVANYGVPDMRRG